MSNISQDSALFDDDSLKIIGNTFLAFLKVLAGIFAIVIFIVFKVQNRKNAIFLKQESWNYSLSQFEILSFITVTMTGPLFILFGLYSILRLYETMRAILVFSLLGMGVSTNHVSLYTSYFYPLLIILTIIHRTIINIFNYKQFSTGWKVRCVYFSLHIASFYWFPFHFHCSKLEQCTVLSALSGNQYCRPIDPLENNRSSKFVQSVIANVASLCLTPIAILFCFFYQKKLKQKIDICPFKINNENRLINAFYSILLFGMLRILIGVSVALKIFQDVSIRSTISEIFLCQPIFISQFYIPMTFLYFCRRTSSNAVRAKHFQQPSTS